MGRVQMNESLLRKKQNKTGKLETKRKISGI